MNRNASVEKKRMTMTEAAAYLGISTATISRIVKRGEISYSVDPLDRRRKLVLVADVKRLKEQSLLAWEEDGSIT